MLHEIYRLRGRGKMNVMQEIMLQLARDFHIQDPILKTHQRRNYHVEVPQVHVLDAAKLRCENPHQHLEVLSSFSRVTGQVTKHTVQLAEIKNKLILIL